MTSPAAVMQNPSTPTAPISSTTSDPQRKGPEKRSTAWWLAMLRRRAERMYEEKLDLSEPIVWKSELERQAAVAFFNAAFRAEESGLKQAHEIAAEIEAIDPELAEVLRLYGNEEGWHRELLTEFLAYIGGEIRPFARDRRQPRAALGRRQLERLVEVRTEGAPALPRQRGHRRSSGATSPMARYR